MTVRDPEVLFELRREPELLAIADALGEVLSAGVRPRSARRRWLAVAAAAAAVGAVAAAVLLFAATGVQPGLADRALAAIGDGPVLHVVTRQTVPSTATLLRLSTGRRVTPPPRVLTTEIWLDRERALEHTITRETGEPTLDTLSTPRGVTSESGPVWTCARIAAHPVEATRAHVSCNVSGENGTKPRHAAERPPPIDPALAGFVDRYRQALASGAARKIGEGTLHGRRVFWLEFRLPDPDTNPRDPRIDFRERVAVDSDTYRPLVIIPVTDGVAARPGYDVLEIRTVARGDADFSRPKPLRSRAPSSISSRVTDTIDLAQASEVLGARALWPGPAIGGLKLVAVQRQEVTTGYGHDSGIAPRVTPVVALIYGGVDRRHATPGSVEITESTVPSAVWWPDTKPVPDGYLRLARMGWGELRAGGLFVRVTRVPTGIDATIVAAARRLAPVPGG
jgi:hypothetical protein